MSTTYHFQTPFQQLEHFSEGKHDAHYIADANGNGICRINHDDRIDPESTHRVVALFTAAPDLEAACRFALAMEDNRRAGVVLTDDDYSELHDRLTRALTAATA